MNRRAFLQAATLSTVAVAHEKTLAAVPSVGRSPEAFEADLSRQASMADLARPEIDLYVQLEEIDQRDPGELSGARLRIGDAGKSICLSAEIGSTQQPAGCRTAHCLGFIDGSAVREMAASAPSDPEAGFVARLRDAQTGSAFSGLCLELRAGGYDPHLALYLGSHCFGVLRGQLLARFFNALRVRSEEGVLR